VIFTFLSISSLSLLLFPTSALLPLGINCIIIRLIWNAPPTKTKRCREIAKAHSTKTTTATKALGRGAEDGGVGGEREGGRRNVGKLAATHCCCCLCCAHCSCCRCCWWCKKPKDDYCSFPTVGLLHLYPSLALIGCHSSETERKERMRWRPSDWQPQQQKGSLSLQLSLMSLMLLLLLLLLLLGLDWSLRLSRASFF